MGPLQRTCATVPRRGPLPKFLWANLLFVVVKWSLPVPNNSPTLQAQAEVVSLVFTDVVNGAAVKASKNYSCASMAQSSGGLQLRNVCLRCRRPFSFWTVHNLATVCCTVGSRLLSPYNHLAAVCCTLCRCLLLPCNPLVVVCCTVWQLSQWTLHNPVILCCILRSSPSLCTHPAVVDCNVCLPRRCLATSEGCRRSRFVPTSCSYICDTEWQQR